MHSMTRTLLQGGYPKLKIGNFVSIDIRKVSNTFSMTGSGEFFTWNCPETGGSVRFFDRAENLVDLSYTHLGRSHDVPIPISRTKCHLGGERAWFHCPYCNDRVAILYIKGPPACRLCWHATYPVQNEDAQLRAWRRAAKIRARLGAPLGIPAYFILKPKGMHWRTYEDLVKEIIHFEKKAWDNCPKWMKALDEDVNQLSMSEM